MSRRRIVKLENIRPLSNVQIDNKMKKFSYYGGTFDANSLPKIPTRYPWAIIVNTQLDTNRRVGHWTAIAWDERNKVTFYDSYGLPPPMRWNGYIKSINGNFSWIRRKTQKFNTATCGYLAMDFITKRIKYKTRTNSDIVKSLNGRKAYNNFK